MAESGVRLICCEDLDSYARVAASCAPERGEAPVLGRPPLLERGFGPVELIEAAAWTASEPRAREDSVRDDASEPPARGAASESETSDATGEPPARDAASEAGDPARLCVVLDEPSCVAIARCLAAASGRALALFDAEDWAQQLEALLARGPLASLTFVVPLWTSQGSLDPLWFGRVLAFARMYEAQLSTTAWGIVTGADPGRLSVLVAKSLVQRQIIAAYASAPAMMFASEPAEAFGSRIEVMAPDPDELPPGALRLIDSSRVRDGSARRLGRRRSSLLYMRGHGRFYCALEGHLCGARPLSVAPEAELESCIDGLSCANPHDGSYDAKLRAFPRIDPRSYDAPLMILATCAVGGWSSPDWARGNPSIAVHALSGAASAVVSSDYVTVSTAAAHIEVFAVLYGSATLGEALSRLNRARPESVAEFPYFLLGDPELPVGAQRWPGWCAESLELARERGPIAQHIRARVSLTHPFARVPLGVRGAHAATTFVRCADPEVELHSLHQLSSDPPELWLSPERRAGAEGDADTVLLDLITVPAPRLSPGLFAAAVTAPLRVRSWADGLQPSAPPLLAAAVQLEQVEALCAKLRGRALNEDPREVLGAVSAARELWLRAHEQALAHLLTFAPRGLWPATVWKSARYRGSTSSDPCPQCGISPTLHRVYDSGPAQQRLQWECVACALVLDRPLAPLPEFSLQMPKNIAPGQTIHAQLRLDNSEGADCFAVAGALLFDRKGHNIPAPPPFRFELEPGAAHEETVEFTLDGPPDIAHRYYARAVLLLNGMWLMATRLISVRAS